VATCTEGSADTPLLFHETFDNYHFSSGSRSNHGIPLGENVIAPDVDEGADETWYGGRFGEFQGGKIDWDVAVRKIRDDKYARFEDRAGILFNISTVGMISATLSFDWKTHNLESDEEEDHESDSGDSLVAGYYIEVDLADPTISNDLGFDLGANRLRDFFTDDFNGEEDDAEDWWSNEWTEILRVSGDNPWTSSSDISLPVGKPSIWVAF